MEEAEEDGQWKSSLKDHYVDNDESLPDCIPGILQNIFTAHRWPVGSSYTKPSRRLPSFHQADLLRDLLTLYLVFHDNETFAEVS